MTEQSRREGVVPRHIGDVPPELIEPKGTPFHRHDRRFSRCVMGFHFRPAYGWSSMAQRRFQPKGLAIWGAPPGATVVQMHCALERPEISGNRFPARFFASGDNYQQIAKLIDEGKEPPNWVNWRELLPGMLALVVVHSADDRLLGPDDGIELCMWGECEIL